MKSICDFFKKMSTVENHGDNFGVEVANNSGDISVYQGLGYSDTKALCLDVVRDELNKYKATALIEAEKRNDELFEQVMLRLSELKMSDEQALAEFQNPSMQNDYYEAQKAYIKAGTPELATVLSDILVKRVNESSRTLLQIALGEAIQVAPKLIKSQMATLALTFMFVHTVRLSVNSHASFEEYIKDEILPVFYDGVSEKHSEFQHLNFTGCSQTAAVRRKLPELIRSSYPGLFMKGFLEAEIPHSSSGVSLLEAYPQLFVKCLGDDAKWQIGTMTDKVLSDLMNSNDIIDTDKKLLSDLFKRNQMSDTKTENLVVKLVPEMQEVFDYWKNSNIALLSLTSVGIVIGAQYCKQITGHDYDLTIWI